MHASWSRQLSQMDVLSCVRVRLRVFSQGFGVAASLNTSLIVAYICVMELGDWDSTGGLAATNTPS